VVVHLVRLEQHELDGEKPHFLSMTVRVTGVKNAAWSQPSTSWPKTMVCRK
jgi:hypothetical protein